jgi:hypothetical protein
LKYEAGWDGRRVGEREGGFPLPHGRAGVDYKLRCGSEKCMALVRSVDVPGHVIGLYFVVISHEM